MIHGNEKLSREDRARLAQLHGQVLSTAMFSRLGSGLLMHYYRFLEQSSKETVFVLRNSGIVAAAAVLSSEGLTLLRRFLWRHPFSFAAAVLVAMLTDGTFRRLFRAYIGEQFQGAEPEEGYPEVLQIYTDPRLRSRGMGAKLMQWAEQSVAASGHEILTVRTLAHDNEPALRFYRRLGYHTLRNSVFCGDTYVCMKKAVKGS
jgi:GNAT superfamily N-acetyltransferase